MVKMGWLLFTSFTLAIVSLGVAFGGFLEKHIHLGGERFSELTMLGFALAGSLILTLALLVYFKFIRRSLN